MFWEKKIETMKQKELEVLQLKRLKTTLSQVQHVAFYRNLLSGAGVKPSSVKTLEDIQKIPFTKKQDLRDGYPFGFFAVPMKKIVRIHTTSGTTGKPTVVGYTRKDLDTWSENCTHPYHIRHDRKTYGCWLYTKRSGHMVRSHSPEYDHGGCW